MEVKSATQDASINRTSTRNSTGSNGIGSPPNTGFRHNLPQIPLMGYSKIAQSKTSAKQQNQQGNTNLNSQSETAKLHVDGTRKVVEINKDGEQEEVILPEDVCNNDSNSATPEKKTTDVETEEDVNGKTPPTPPIKLRIRRSTGDVEGKAMTSTVLTPENSSNEDLSFTRSPVDPSDAKLPLRKRGRKSKELAASIGVSSPAVTATASPIANPETLTQLSVGSPQVSTPASADRGDKPPKYIIGDMMWAKVTGHPWWPCMVAPDPFEALYTKIKARTKSSSFRLYHVQFFGDECERGWVSEASTIEYAGRDKLLSYFKEMQTKLNKKQKQLHQFYKLDISARRRPAWEVAAMSAAEAFPLTRAERKLRYSFDYEPLLEEIRKEKEKADETGESEGDVGTGRTKTKAGLKKALLSARSNRIQGQPGSTTPTTQSRSDYNVSFNESLNGDVSKEKRRRQSQTTDEIIDSLSPKKRNRRSGDEPATFTPVSNQRTFVYSKSSAEGSFDVFVQKHCESVLSEHPDFDRDTLLDYLKQQWSAMSDKQKSRYKSKFPGGQGAASPPEICIDSPKDQPSSPEVISKRSGRVSRPTVKKLEAFEGDQLIQTVVSKGRGRPRKSLDSSYELEDGATSAEFHEFATSGGESGTEISSTQPDTDTSKLHVGYSVAQTATGKGRAQSMRSIESSHEQTDAKKSSEVIPTGDSGRGLSSEPNTPEISEGDNKVTSPVATKRRSRPRRSVEPSRETEVSEKVACISPSDSITKKSIAQVHSDTSPGIAQSGELGVPEIAEADNNITQSVTSKPRSRPRRSVEISQEVTDTKQSSEAKEMVILTGDSWIKVTSGQVGTDIAPPKPQSGEPRAQEGDHQGTQPVPSKGRSRHTRSFEPSSETADAKKSAEFQQTPGRPRAEICQELYETIKDFKTDDGRLLCEAFSRLPKRRTAPDYYDVVSTPIDLLKIQQKIKMEEYDDLEQMSADVELLVNNAKAYYKKSSQEYKDACDLWELYIDSKTVLISEVFGYIAEPTPTPEPAGTTIGGEMEKEEEEKKSVQSSPELAVSLKSSELQEAITPASESFSDTAQAEVVPSTPLKVPEYSGMVVATRQDISSDKAKKRTYTKRRKTADLPPGSLQVNDKAPMRPEGQKRTYTKRRKTVEPIISSGTEEYEKSVKSSRELAATLKSSELQEATITLSSESLSDAAQAEVIPEDSGMVVATKRNNFGRFVSDASIKSEIAIPIDTIPVKQDATCAAGNIDISVKDADEAVAAAALGEDHLISAVKAELPVSKPDVKKRTYTKKKKVPTATLR